MVLFFSFFLFLDIRGCIYLQKKKEHSITAEIFVKGIFTRIPISLHLYIVIHPISLHWQSGEVRDSFVAFFFLFPFSYLFKKKRRFSILYYFILSDN